MGGTCEAAGDAPRGHGHSGHVRGTLKDALGLGSADGKDMKGEHEVRE